MAWEKQDFEASLVGRLVKPLVAEKRAAVAVLIRFEEAGEPEALLMQRAECEGDPWSGHVCLPGGKAEKDDINLHATVRRETEEELGFDLHQIGKYLGPLDPLHARSKGLVISTSIEPFVFLQETTPTVLLGQEAEDAFWLPLRGARRGDFDTVYRYASDDRAAELPAWSFEGHVVWGLTLQILLSMLRLVGAR